MSKEENCIELKRHPDICCPEPSCDYTPFDFKQCKSCGHVCSDCKVFKAMKEITIARLQTLPPNIRISIG